MKIHFDEKADAVYIQLNDRKKIIDSQEVERNVILDFDSDGKVVGIEILKAKQHIPLKQLKQLNFQINLKSQTNVA